MRKAPSTDQRAARDAALHPGVVAVNASVVAFVDELLRLPSRAAVATVVSFLYGQGLEALSGLLGHVNGGIHVPLHSLLTSPRPLAVLMPKRLRVSGAWRKPEQALKGARAAARARYRELQSAFVTQARRAAPEASASLVRYTYGVDGRQWLWEDAAARVMHRTTALNRAVLGLLAAAARGETAIEFPAAGEGVPAGEFDLPGGVLDLMAAALPPVASPDWPRIAGALEGGAPALQREESILRYQSLLAEILGLTTVQGEAPA